MAPGAGAWRQKIDVQTRTWPAVAPLFYLALLIGLFCDALLFIVVRPPFYDRARRRFLKQDFLL